MRTANGMRMLHGSRAIALVALVGLVSGCTVGFTGGRRISTCGAPGLGQPFFGADAVVGWTTPMRPVLRQPDGIAGHEKKGDQPQDIHHRTSFSQYRAVGWSVYGAGR